MFEETYSLLADPLVQMWWALVDILPSLVAAVLILILGYLLGALIGHIAKKILEKTKAVDYCISKMGLRKDIGKWNITGFVGLIIKWYIFIIFLNPAAQVVRLDTLAVFFSSVAMWVPNIILAVVIVLIGYISADYLSEKIKDTKGQKVSLMAQGAKAITLIFVVLIALKQIGIEVGVAENAFLIVLAGIMLAVAIAFGLGFKDEARGIVKHIMKKL